MNKRISAGMWWIVALVFISPLAIIVINSLKTFQEILLKPVELPEALQWQNYVEVYKITNFPRVFLNTIIIIVSSVFGVVITSSLIGYALSRTKTKVSGIIFTLVLLSMMIPFQTIMIPIVRVTQLFGMRGSVFSLIPIYIGMSGAMAVLLYHGFSNGIPKTLEESSRMEGCCGLNMFFRVIFPLFKPVTATVAVLYVLQFWNDITLPMMLLTNKENTTIALSQLIFYRELVSSRWNLLLAAAVMASTPVIIFYILMQKKIIAGVMQGALKG